MVKINSYFPLKYLIDIIYYTNFLISFFLILLFIKQSFISSITVALFLLSIILFILSKIFHYNILYKSSNFILIFIIFIYTIYINLDLFYLIFIYLFLFIDHELFSFISNFELLFKNYFKLGEYERKIVNNNLVYKLLREFLFILASFLLSLVFIILIRPITIFSPLFSVFLFIILSLFIFYFLIKQYF